MEIQFCGGAGTVTGSKHYVVCNEFQFLVDCGLVQERGKANQNWEPFLNDPSRLNAVFLTHAHLDHCGLLPKLVADGFHGRIYGTHATLELAKLVLLDSARIQEEDALFKQKRHKKEGRVSPRPIRPLYRTVDVEAALKLFHPLPYAQQTQIAPGVDIVFHEAGHILGSAFIEVILSSPQVNDNERRLLFSGDIGRANRPIIRDPEFFRKDVPISKLLIESTYGDKTSESTDSVDDKLAEIVSKTLQRGGKAIMPVFAVERAQETLCRFAKLIQEKKLPSDVPIYLDSPMAVEALDVFNRRRDYFDSETLKIAESAEATLQNLHLLKKPEESRLLNHLVGPAIIMSSSGMCNAGRIKHHLANHIDNPKNTIVFLGYQAEGTLGRQILDGVTPVRILGQPHHVRAEVAMIRGVSGHADQNELLAWYAAIPQHPETTFVVHGEPYASRALVEKIKALAPETTVVAPAHMEIYKD